MCAPPPIDKHQEGVIRTVAMIFSSFLSGENITAEGFLRIDM